MSDETPNVAIVCQGGGSHTAFTAGVLGELFDDPDLNANVVGFSGTSGGAICALLAWYGRVHPDHTPRRLLTDFWADLAARTHGHRFANAAVQWGSRLEEMGYAMPTVSPYHSPGAQWGQQEMRQLLERHVDFSAVPDLLDGSEPALLISAIDVLSGEFRIFREDEVCPEAVLASAAEPHLFEAVEYNGGLYWDGLFSKNPPIQDFMTMDDVEDPDEIWLVKINPQERARVPKTLAEIDDRRNELAGNLSMNGEIRFIRQVNQWIDRGYLPDRYTHTEIKRIRFSRQGLDWRTKLDRNPAFLERLIGDGERAAAAFLDEQGDGPAAQ